MAKRKTKAKARTRSSSGTRAKSKERLERLKEGYPVRDPKTGKVTVKKGKRKYNSPADDRKYQQDKLKKAGY